MILEPLTVRKCLRLSVAGAMVSATTTEGPAVAINPTARVSGTLISRERIQGTSSNGRPYDFVTTRVLVGSAGLIDVTLPDDYVSPEVGEPVDWVVELTASGDATRARLVRDWV